MKIYTRTGDDGSTGLLGPGRVRKSAPRVEAYGSVDELNAALGMVRAHDGSAWLTPQLDAIQAALFTLGAELAATVPDALAKLERLADSDVDQLERWIDRFEADLPKLTRFILPGGTPLAAQLHVARTECRRAERRLVALGEVEAIDLRLVRYLNRLADLLFVMGRWCNARAGTPDVPWEPSRRATHGE